MLIGKAGFRLREPAEADVKAEVPVLLSDVLEVYRRSLGYSHGDLADLMALYPHELAALYGIGPESQRDRPRLRLVGSAPAG